MDGFRFLAIFGVLLFHLNGYLLAKAPVTFHDNTLTQAWIHAWKHGGMGVNVFFVISGFILALPFAKHYLHEGKSVPLGRYYMRRLTRLEPPYILSMLLIFAMQGINKGLAHSKEQLDNLGASLLYIHNIVYQTMSPVNAVSWSLEVEIQFYILVPLLVMVFRLPTIPRRLLLLLVMVLNAIAVVPMLPQHPLHVLGYMQYFLGGFLLAELFLEGLQERKTGWANLWVTLHLVGMWAATYHEVTLTIALPFLTVGLFYWVFRSTVWSRLFGNLYIRTIGGMCYSIYLWHYVLISIFGRFTTKLFPTQHYLLYFVIQALLLVPLVLFFSGLFYVFVERPCMDHQWPTKLWRWLRGQRSTTPETQT